MSFRGVALVCASLALGGVAWTWRVLRVEPYTKPDHATRLALRVVAVAAAGVAATQLALMTVALTALADAHGAWPTLPDVLQHRLFVALLMAFGVFEWAVRTSRVPARPWSYVFPLLCVIGGGLLLTHSHAMFNLKQEFLTEMTHAPVGVLGVFAGWGRWLELRMPEAPARAGWLWTLCFSTVGLVLLVYREG